MSSGDSNLPKAQYYKGIALACVTMLIWGVQPFIMKVALLRFSAFTISWVRLTFAFLVLFVILQRHHLKPISFLLRPPLLGILGGLFLGLNYFSYIEGINLAGPTSTQIVIQIAPVGLTLAGVVLFKESLLKRQIIGLVLALIGLVLFYMDRMKAAEDITLYHSGNLYVLLAALTWIGWGIAQKKLGKEYNPQKVNLLCFLTASLVNLGMVSWQQFASVNFYWFFSLFLLGVCTTVAYGCLAQAIKLIPLVHVSVLIVLNPLITLSVVAVLEKLGITWMDSGLLGGVGYLGALTAIVGVVLVVSKRQIKEKDAA